MNFLALIGGGIGPDVWDKEYDISAVDFMDAAKLATARAKQEHGFVISLEQSWISPNKSGNAKAGALPQKVN